MTNIPLIHFYFFSRAELEEDLASLVSENFIPVRIDTRTGLAIVKEKNQRLEAIQSAAAAQEIFIWKVPSQLSPS